MVLHVIGSVLLGLLASKGISVPVEINLVFSELTILIPAFLFILNGNYSFRDELGFRPVKAGTVLMCVLLTFLVTPVVSFVNVLSQLFVKNEIISMSGSLLAGSDLTVLFLAGVYGPLCEEILFRAIFCNRYEVYTGPVRAGLISALLFALAHMNINQATYAFVLGFIFAVINKAANSVYPSIIIHCMINLGNVLVLIIINRIGKGIGADTDLAVAAEQARKGDMIYVLIGVLLVAAIISTVIAIPCIVWMSEHEGNKEAFYDMFARKHESKGWISVPMVIAVLFILFMMFGLGPLLEVINR